MILTLGIIVPRIFTVEAGVLVLNGSCVRGGKEKARLGGCMEKGMEEGNRLGIQGRASGKGGRNCCRLD